MPSSSNSLNSPICWYPSLELIQLNFSLWPNIIRFAIFAKRVEFVARLIPFSWAYSTEFQSLAKYRQICHICQVRRFRWIPCSVGTILLILFNWISVFGELSSDFPYVLSSSNSPPCWYPSPEFIQLKFSLWRNIVTFTIFAKFVEFVEFVPLLVPFSWAYSIEFQSLAKYHQICHICQIRRIRRPVDTLLLSLLNWILVFSEISSHSPSLPSSSNSLNSLLCWYPSLELIQLNFSLAKYRHICHICQVRRIRWSHRSVGTLLLSLFNYISVFGEISSLIRHLCKIRRIPWIRRYVDTLLLSLYNWISVWRNIVKFAIFAKFVEFVEFAALLVPFSWAYSTKFQSLAKYRHWFAIFAKFVEFLEFAAMLIPFSWAYSTEFQSLAKYHQICHICQTCRIRRPVGTLLLSLFNWISVFGQISSDLPYVLSLSNSPPCWYPSPEFIQLNFSLWQNTVKFAIFAKFVEFVEFAALLIPFSWAYSTEF